MCKEKDKLHRKFKNSKNLKSEINFKTARREFKKLIKSKMRANLDEPEKKTLTKKFWSHVKSASKSNRIPEVVARNGVTASDARVKANMFNKYFLEQFSDSSTYDIDIDFTNDKNFDMDFSEIRIKSILDNIDTNKAQGPDGINGIVLKHCSESLSYPLSKFFKLVYNTGYLPSE